MNKYRGNEYWDMVKISNEDKEYAITHFKLNADNCHTITYGFELKKIIFMMLFFCIY
jgi:hypothetical protein